MWSWPRPVSRNSPVRSSRFKREAAVLLDEPVQRLEDLVLLALVLGLDRERDDAARRRHRASMRSACCSSQSVSPVWVSFSLGIAAIWPGRTSVTSSVCSPCRRRSLPTRSRAPVRAFSSVMSLRSVPEKTRRIESMSGVAIGDRLPDQRRDRRRGVGGELDLVPRRAGALRGVRLGRGREDVRRPRSRAPCRRCSARSPRTGAAAACRSPRPCAAS